MDRSALVALAPHYVAMLALVYGLLVVWWTFVGDLNLVEEFIIVLVVVFAYRPVVKRLGLAPEPWRDAEPDEADEA